MEQLFSNVTALRRKRNKKKKEKAFESSPGPENEDADTQFIPQRSFCLLYRDASHIQVLLRKK